MPDSVAAGDLALHGGYSVTVGVPGALEMIDTFDRPRKPFSAGTYAGAGTFADGFEANQEDAFPKQECMPLQEWVMLELSGVFLMPRPKGPMPVQEWERPPRLSVPEPLPERKWPVLQPLPVL
ncbi:hypothetical protein Q5P01_008212 [Channa striata]|uniref:Uncharacterized protein n=1 Tax=Channa striata TaxID=64152 RepID=A0AA88SX28_CHASR|nr:hypothetical protein Q5P01_008212 [Channa striata]